MKTSIKIIAVLCLTPLLSCTKTIYTHEEVMSRYVTKNDVTKQFGNPAEKLTGETTEQWLYSFQKLPGQQPEFVVVKNTNTKDVQSFSRYDRFIIFQFNKQGDVIQTFAQRVDFAQKKFSACKTIALIGISAGTVALIFLLSSNSQ